MRAPLTIAAAQPRCVAKNVRANALAHADLIRKAEARVIVFPELSLTGYELDADTVSPGDEALSAIVAACAQTGSAALVGVPLADGPDAAYIGALLVSADGVEVAYRKSYPGGDEVTRFSPGDGAKALDLDGWRIGLGICRDTGVDQHVADTAALDVDVYAAGLVHRPEELEVQERRGVRIARACNAYVVFASCAGPTGGGYDRTAGVSTIWDKDGTPLDRAGTEPGDLAQATLT